MVKAKPYLLVWKHKFRMLYIYFSIYSFRIGLLNGRLEIGFMRTWKAGLRGR